MGENGPTLHFSDGSNLPYRLAVRDLLERGHLQVISFDIGHGNSTRFRLPNGKNLLVDSAKPEEADAVVLPYLRQHHIHVD